MPPHRQFRLIFVTESIRYLDVHPILPDGSPPELKESFDALLTPLLLNSALAAIRVQPVSDLNAKSAVKNTTRALDKLELNTADQGIPIPILPSYRISDS